MINKSCEYDMCDAVLKVAEPDQTTVCAPAEHLEEQIKYLDKPIPPPFTKSGFETTIGNYGKILPRCLHEAQLRAMLDKAEQAKKRVFSE